MILSSSFSVVSGVFRDRRGLPDEESGDTYFSIGHGDNEDYYVWVWINGGLDSRGPFHTEKTGDRTHASFWGHDVAERIYKGRYDVETGDLTIVVPERLVHREVPSSLINALNYEFPDNKVIHIF